MRFLLWGSGSPLTTAVHELTRRGKPAAPPPDVQGTETWCFEVDTTQPDIEEMRFADSAVRGYAEISDPQHLAEVIHLEAWKRR